MVELSDGPADDRLRRMQDYAEDVFELDIGSGQVLRFVRAGEDDHLPDGMGRCGNHQRKLEALLDSIAAASYDGPQDITLTPADFERVLEDLVKAQELCSRL
ncbi:MAG TPA: hypothetical protein VMO81_03000 [Aestuariivirgaceae bacterium]|nr:hypothetical protein [Aestuariivirgaceae bacterium]